MTLKEIYHNKESDGNNRKKHSCPNYKWVGTFKHSICLANFTQPYKETPIYLRIHLSKIVMKNLNVY